MLLYFSDKYFPIGNFRENVIGVTGTKGKSTTAALIAHLLGGDSEKVSLLGNIGQPMLSTLCDERSRKVTASKTYVLELSSYQLEDCRYSPSTAVLLEIVPEHLDYHGSFEKYAAAKLHIFRNQSADGVLFLNRDNHKTLNLADYGGRICELDCDSSFHFDPKSQGLFFGKKLFIESKELPLVGRGNIENILAALSVAHTQKVDLATLRERLRTFTALLHRLNRVAEKKGVTFYNDSLATVPEATINALAGLGDEVFSLIAGGHDRGLDLKVLGNYLVNSSVRLLIGLPVTGERIYQEFLGAGGDESDLKFVQVRSMTEAVKTAAAATPGGRSCILSPAASSLNLFRDYADRGEQFVSAVNEL